MKEKLSAFQCDVLYQSTSPQSLREWLMLLPMESFDSMKIVGLPKNLKRFTVLRSPLGNKKAKDQYEHIQYGGLLRLTTREPVLLLRFLQSISSSGLLKLRIKVTIPGSSS
uniref:Ribosomal protein S10 n=1 Tax=Schizocladia ischiensis TaxID=196139 RepID=A0A7S6UA60_9STRA|nr:ribosomal protein S10 [Schizocladia ischiensis]QOW07620.1 ribosomal protein S10 [Schizocladia ischiensis]